MAERPELTGKESNIDVVVFGDTEEIEQSTNAQVDKGLNSSLISKAMIVRLGAELKPCHLDAVKDSAGKAYTPIGKVDLLWHKKTASRSIEQTFFVVDLPGPDVIFGADAITSEDPSNIHTLGLNNQNAEAKKIQESKKEMELAKRAEEKKKQEQREKQKQGQSKSSSSR